MTNPNVNSSTSEEMDLTDIFALFKRMFYSFLAFCFRILDFMLKFWWVIVLLIIAGFCLGYFTKGPKKYEATLILQTNFNSQPYVYNAIKQFDDNLGEKDTAFMEKEGVNPSSSGITSLDIEPVIDVISLMDDIKSDRALATIIDELSVDDEIELFASERFYTNYKFHKLIIGLQEEANKEGIDLLMRYINEQPLMASIKEESVKNLEERISKNDKTLDQIDKLIDSYAESTKIASNAGNNLAYFNNQNNLNINGALTLKNEVLIENEDLKNQLITMDGVAVIVGNVETTEKQSLKDKKEIIYPVIFVFLFLLAAGCINGYRMLKRKIEAEGYLA